MLHISTKQDVIFSISLNQILTILKSVIKEAGMNASTLLSVSAKEEHHMELSKKRRPGPSIWDRPMRLGRTLGPGTSCPKHYLVIFKL